MMLPSTRRLPSSNELWIAPVRVRIDPIHEPAAVRRGLARSRCAAYAGQAAQAERSDARCRQRDTVTSRSSTSLVAASEAATEEATVSVDVSRVKRLRRQLPEAFRLPTEADPR